MQLFENVGRARVSWGLPAILLLLTAGPAILSPPPVDAYCVRGPGPSKVVWSYPNDGAQDVPIDASLWLRMERPRFREARLNGEKVRFERLGSQGYQIHPGQMEPDRNYTLTLQGKEGTDPLELRFRTGSRRAAEGPESEIAEAVISSGYPSGKQWPADICAMILAQQACFDDGQDTLVSMNMKTDDAVAWVLSWTKGDYDTPVIWPGECGPPSAFLQGFIVERACFGVRALGIDGTLGPAASWCYPTAATGPVETVIVPREGQYHSALPKLLERVELDPPRLSDGDFAEGVIYSQAEIDTDGRLKNIQIQAARGINPFNVRVTLVEALKGWRFEPPNAPVTIDLKTHFNRPSE